MKKGLIILLALGLAAASALGLWKWSTGRGRPVETAQAKEGATAYNCAMHPSFLSTDKDANCPICGMTLSSMDKAPQSGQGQGSGGKEKTILFYRDPMHPWITSDKPGKSPDCGMDMVPVYEGEAGSGIRIDPTTVQNMGVQTQNVERMKLTKDIRTTGKVTVDESRYFAVNSRIMGWVEKLHVDVTGQRVRKGQALLELYSPDLVSTQEEYLQALRYMNSLGTDAGADAKKSARQLVESSRRRLRNWEITEAQIQALEKQGAARNTLALHAPADGIVLEKMVMQGQNVMPGMALYKLADLSKVWVVANVYQGDLAVVKTGAQADIELSYLPGRNFHGKVTFVSPILDPESKTAEVRIEVANTPALDLKPEMFATVVLRSPAPIEGVAIPEQAIIRSGKRNVTIVSLGGGYFEPREVKLGQSAEGYVQVLEGLKEGEKLVISSQFLIDSESNLKAAIQQMQAHPEADSMPDGMAAPEASLGMESHEGHTQMKSDASEAYTCPMHSQVVKDKPGKCPICGMDLVKKR